MTDRGPRQRVPIAARLMFAFCAVSSSLLLTSRCTAAEEFSSKQLDFFESRIRPVLIEHCLECHSGGAKQKGGLDLSFRNGLLNGGESGPAVVPGKPDESLLVQALQYESYEMPPEGRLSERIIADFETWIRMGAADPRKKLDDPPARESDEAVEPLWSLQPLRVVEPPKVAGVDSPIDRFILAKLNESEVPLAPAASPRVLNRRISFVLTGLPHDQSTDEALASRVDRLLGSPEFGERWARHWLDLTAYADTIGIGRAIPALEAWRYRDYVINAFNADKPFDEFVRQQVAGDIFVPPVPTAPAGSPPTAESITATGFLAIGPWELVNGDKPQLRMDVVDRQVHRIGQAFLGMTFGCARCHDHKFDPVSQRDYYALAGFFTSTVTLNGRIGGVFSAINQRPLPEAPDDLLARADRIRVFEAEVAELTAARDAANARVAELRKQIEGAADSERPELEKLRDAATADARQHSTRLNVLDYLRSSRTQSVALALMDAPEPSDCAINVRGNAHQLGDVIPRGFPSEIAPTDKPQLTRGGSGRVQLAAWLTDPGNPLTARVWVNRVWHHLFGAGLVRTVDNFGTRGEKPSHPELLDWLADEFIRDGWSTKRLIRRIILTKTWQQASTNHAAVETGILKSDPDNRLLWRANRRRLEAEAIRDAMLAVSGQLSDKRGGPTLPVDHPGNLSTALTGSIKPSAKFPKELKRRRSVYLPQQRKTPFDEIDFLAAFDLPDPSQETGRRTSTTVPTQALYLLNSPFVQDCATVTANRILDQAEDRRDRVVHVYETVLGRGPSDTEANDALFFLSQLQADEPSQGGGAIGENVAWARLCQSLLISNEFLFRD